MKETRYDRYKRLCDERDTPPQLRRWQTHLSELERRSDQPFVRLTKAELFAFWRERFSEKELFRMAAGIDSTMREDRSL